MLSRRAFLKTTTSGLAALLVPPALLRARPARADGPEPVLVVLFLRGGADGLNLVVPHGDPLYYQLRPTIGVSSGSVLDLDGFFGLHPSLGPLQPLYASGQLAAIHACGSPDPTRSHFDAQDYMEYGAPGDRTVRDGWMNRYLAAAGFSDSWAAVTIGSRPAKALAGPKASLAMPTIESFGLFGAHDPPRRALLEKLFARAGGPLTEAVESTFAAFDVIGGIDRSTSVTYPATSITQPLKDLAALVKAQVGVRVATLDMGGWDHHYDERLYLPRVATELATALVAFAADLGSHLSRTLTLVVTEFGRRAEENGSFGTDHGHGGALLALGGGIAGGRVLLRGGSWPGLAPAQLDQGDLRMTMDFRHVYLEALNRQLGLSNLSSIFPGFAASPALFPGLYV